MFNRQASPTGFYHSTQQHTYSMPTMHADWVVFPGHYTDNFALAESVGSHWHHYHKVIFHHLTSEQFNCSVSNVLSRWHITHLSLQNLSHEVAQMLLAKVNFDLLQQIILANLQPDTLELICRKLSDFMINSPKTMKVVCEGNDEYKSRLAFITAAKPVNLRYLEHQRKAQIDARMEIDTLTSENNRLTQALHAEQVTRLKLAKEHNNEIERLIARHQEELQTQINKKAKARLERNNAVEKIKPLEDTAKSIAKHQNAAVNESKKLKDKITTLENQLYVSDGRVKWYKKNREQRSTTINSTMEIIFAAMHKALALNTEPSKKRRLSHDSSSSSEPDSDSSPSSNSSSSSGSSSSSDSNASEAKARAYHAESSTLFTTRPRKAPRQSNETTSSHKFQLKRESP